MKLTKLMLVLLSLVVTSCGLKNTQDVRDDDAQRDFDAHQAQIDKCERQFFKKHPQAKGGTLVVEIELNAGAVVETVREVKGFEGSDEVVKCLNISRWKFTPQKTKMVTTYTFDVTR
jgi:hypothetical protein